VNLNLNTTFDEDVIQSSSDRRKDPFAHPSAVISTSVGSGPGRHDEDFARDCAWVVDDKVQGGVQVQVQVNVNVVRR